MNSALIIAIGIVLLLALLTWALFAGGIKAAKKKKEELRRKLDGLAHDHDTAVGPSDFLGSKAIALDVKKGKIFYVGHTEAAQAEVINIDEVSSCAVLRKGTKLIHSSKSGKVTTEERVTRILLELKMKEGSVRNLPIYDEANDGPLEMPTLKEKAEKWTQLINNAA